MGFRQLSIGQMCVVVLLFGAFCFVVPFWMLAHIDDSKTTPNRPETVSDDKELGFASVPGEKACLHTVREGDPPVDAWPSKADCNRWCLVYLDDKNTAGLEDMERKGELLKIPAGTLCQVEVREKLDGGLPLTRVRILEGELSGKSVWVLEPFVFKLGHYHPQPSRIIEVKDLIAEFSLYPTRSEAKRVLKEMIIRGQVVVSTASPKVLCLGDENSFVKVRREDLGMAVTIQEGLAIECFFDRPVHAKVGDTVTVKGTCGGVDGQMIMFGKCTIYEE